MSQLAIKGHPTRGNEVIEILEMLGYVNIHDYIADTDCLFFYGGESIKTIYYDWVYNCEDMLIFTIEEFLKKFPYKVGDKVQHKGATSCGSVFEVEKMRWEENTVKYTLRLFGCNYKTSTLSAEYLQPYKEETMDKINKAFFDSNAQCCDISNRLIKEDSMEDKGNISDGYHTFNELYEYRLLYNASMFNELAKQGLYDVHKSKRHSDGTIPFGDENWFIVQAELPTGQISNHYEMKDWELFNVPEKEKANPYDGHTPQDVAKRLRIFLTPKPQYPKTYEECCKVLSLGEDGRLYTKGYKASLIQELQQLLICRDAYWKIAGEQMGLDKLWEPESIEMNYAIVCRDDGDFLLHRRARAILIFPTKEIRDAFYENFKDLIKECKELL